MDWRDPEGTTPFTPGQAVEDCSFGELSFGNDTNDRGSAKRSVRPMIYGERLCQLPAGGSLTVQGLRGSSPALLAATIAEARPCCCILSDENLVANFASDLKLFTDREVLIYPGQEIPPYTPLSPDQRITAERLSTLYRLEEIDRPILITSIEALLRRIMPRQNLFNSADYVEANQECDFEGLLNNLHSLGYEQTALVQTVGDYAHRGGIVDIYPPPFLQSNGQLHQGPLRLDFFGDTLDSIRSFDPVTQRSVDTVKDATLLPVTDILLPADSLQRGTLVEQFGQMGEEQNWNSEETARIISHIKNGIRFAGMESFLPLYYGDGQQSSSVPLDYLPQESLLLLCDPDAIGQAMHISIERIESNHRTAQSRNIPALPPSRLFLSEEEVKKRLAAFPRVLVSDFPGRDEETLTIRTSNHQLLKQEIALRRAKSGLLSVLAEQITTWQKEAGRVVICCRSPRRTQNLSELLPRYHNQISLLPSPLQLARPEQDISPEILYLCDHPLAQGFSLSDAGLHIVSESELFGEMRVGGKSKRRARGEPIRFTELEQGDIVVHRDHGLGIYRGMSTLTFQGIKNDFMLIEYRDGDKLYLPVDRLHLVSRYQGLSDRPAKIDKLGAQSWKATTSRIKKEVWKVALELLDIYAKREIRQGRRFSAPGEMFHELEESFAFDETPGQAQSIRDVLDDLSSDKPMDRLVCGDVGYGKTEVAVRAAFKVVEDGFQVAILVPTTVLAEQHAKTFQERLNGFPVNIECINRFRSTAQQRQIIRKLAEGSIDIIIGTHRLLSKDVEFNNLGLLIIDEEHRFGVAHKEKLKKMRAIVDILTLTATPIPRTLQMSLLSIRDLSVISTPPEQRQPVKTFVAQFDELVIKEAVTKELRRGGQVFFVHNRVRTIQRTAAMVQKLVPEAKIAIAHGQMAGKELEEVMVAFVSQKINVLVATTIIESGLDIPSANTIIINRADLLGLAEIYQLRGRVGRSSTQSFAYLLVPSMDSLTRESKERLRALIDCSELGGGFKLAMSDLQIRGGGNLLGVSQSGNIAAIGYDLYLDLLQRTVADLKARSADGLENGLEEEIDPEVNLQISAYIPGDYIPNIGQRYIMYRKIAALAKANTEDMDDLKEELRDRYGPLPGEAENLFRIVHLKKILAALHIHKLEQGRDNLVFSFLKTTPIHPETLLAFVAQQTSRKKNIFPKLTPDNRLILPLSLDSEELIFSGIHTTLDLLQRLEKNA